MKMRCIPKVEFHPASKETEMIIFAGKWVQLELLSEVTQGQKDKCCVTSLMHSFRFGVPYLSVDGCVAAARPQITCFPTLTVAEPVAIREMMS